MTKKIFLSKFSQVNFRKSHEILDQFDKSIKSYIKMFKATDLLGCPVPGRVKSLPQKIKSRFIKFDIVEFYPSISEELPNRFISFARSITTISNTVINIIYHSRKYFLFDQTSTWERKQIILCLMLRWDLVMELKFVSLLDFTC